MMSFTEIAIASWINIHVPNGFVFSFSYQKQNKNEVCLQYAHEYKGVSKMEFILL